MVTGMKSLMRIYGRVNHLTDAQTQEAAAQERAARALTEVATYPECFPCENEEQRDERLELRGPANGEMSDLAHHFQKLDSRYAKLGMVEVIFVIQNELDAQKVADGEEEDSPNLLNKNDEEDSSETQMNEAAASSDNDKFKEETKMSSTTNILEDEEKRIREMGEEALTGKTSTTGPASMPKGEDTVSAAVARRERKAHEATLRTNSENSRVEKVVFSKPILANVLVEGEEAMGRVLNPDKTLQKFYEAVAEIDKDTGARIGWKHGTNVTEAEEIEKALLQAKEDENFRMEVNFSKTSPAIVGFVAKLGSEGEERKATPQQLMDYLINNTLGVMIIDKENNLQVQVKKVTPKNSTGGKAADPKTDKTNPYKGLATLKYANRRIDGNDQFMTNGMGVFKKDVNKDVVKLEKGPKSKAACHYQNAQGKNRTFRVPLQAEQYELVLNEDYSCFEKDGGTKVTTIDLSDAAALAKLESEMAEITAAVAGATNVAVSDDSIIAKVRKESAEENAKKAAADAEDLVNGLE